MESRRGFAALSTTEEGRAKQREIASRGGRAAHAAGTAHEFNSSEGREAGRKGGTKVAQDRDHMREIGRRGGQKRGENLRKRNEAQPPIILSDRAPTPNDHAPEGAIWVEA